MQNKIINIIICFFFSISILEAQYALNTDFNYGIMDNNICLKLEKSKGRNTFGAGFRIHINFPYPTEPEHTFFYRNGYGDKFSNFIGLNVGYQRTLNPQKWKNISIFAFDDAFYLRMKTRQILYDVAPITFKDANFIENYMGFGAKIKIIKPVSLNLKVGGGLLFVWDIDRQIGIDDHWTWQFAALFSAGINVKL